METDCEALHHKYRPRTLEEVAGNEGSIKMVQGLLGRDFLSIPRTWLFIGESGTGKTTMIRIIKDMLGCSDADFHEYDSASTRGIDTIREVKNMARLAAMDGEIKIYFFDEFHMATKEAKAGCLKMFEDAPANTFFFIATTNPGQIPAEIKTRCTTIKMKPLANKQIVEYLKGIVEDEGIQGYPDNLLAAIAKASQGSCREAVKCLDQVIDIEDDDMALQAIESYLGTDSGIDELCRALLANSPWKNIAAIIKTLDIEPEHARLVILKWFSKVLLDKDDPKIGDMLEIFRNNYYDCGKAGLISDCYAASKI